jgi:hypothetical protein
MERLQATLDQERQDRQREVAELERRNVAAKDKLKSEMFEKIKETKTVRGVERQGCVCVTMRCPLPSLGGRECGTTWAVPCWCCCLQSILLATSDQLHYTTKRTMVENEQMSTELTYQVCSRGLLGAGGGVCVDRCGVVWCGVVWG